MRQTQLQYFIELGLKTFAEITMFRTLRTQYNEQESVKIIQMQRG